MKRFFVILLPVIFFISCSNSSESELTQSGNLAEVSHPTPRNIPSDDEVADILIIGKQYDETFSQNIEQLNHMEVYASIGGREGGDEQMFGRIEDVAIDTRNRIFLLDSGRQLVRVFTAEGDYLTTLGGRGQGPGEFERAQSIATVEDQWVLVGNGFRIEVFDITGEMVFKESVQLEKPVISMCAIGNTLFVQSVGLSNDDEVSGENYRHMIHAYSLQTFDHLFSFGQSYGSSNPFVVDRMSVGALSCNESSGMVVFAFERVNVIQGYSAGKGSLQWVTRIDDINLPAIIESIRDGRPTISYGIPDGGVMDIISAPVTLDNVFIILQIFRTTPGTPDGRRYHTFVLNSSDGTGGYLSDNIPEISDYYNGYVVSRGVTQNLTVSQIYHLNPEQ